ncbi:MULTISPECIES: hypothetical protein [Bacillus cereus group]|uniref:hypothetical protein n=1 Tax=Bacillus cereus group TaxID=86661 RepID=UPI0018CEEF19|nr:MULTISPECIES: hypothetical protein [Bacillus cereus group]MBG9839044.1 hypothetical protein [Bacillus tropicus]MBG9875247.1 hypothetical protein [Bacillus tropicus]MBG9919617.1 hypothetical protein [Bacillus tropicus]MBJ8354761.1 hypothetical protein [Bacillus mycoides]MED2903789.1 hypothetical protein [Bacillus tropicus]
MSISICVYSRDGIVLASDSRLTLTNTQVKNGVMYSDNTTKTFLAKQIGISFTGISDIDSVHISKFINIFISENINDETCVSVVPKLLKDYFNKLKANLTTTFFVAGYHKKTKEQLVYSVELARNIIVPISTKEPDAAWHGDPSDILSRLYSHVHHLNIDSKGRIIGHSELDYYPIPFQHFNIQDAIDFAVHCVKVVEEIIRFQPRAQSVSGSVDVLVIKPDEAFWVYKKELHIK